MSESRQLDGCTPLVKRIISFFAGYLRLFLVTLPVEGFDGYPEGTESFLPAKNFSLLKGIFENGILGKVMIQ